MVLRTLHNLADSGKQRTDAFTLEKGVGDDSKYLGVVLRQCRLLRLAFEETSLESLVEVYAVVADELLRERPNFSSWPT